MDRNAFLKTCCFGACGLAVFGGGTGTAGEAQGTDAAFAARAQRWFVAMMAGLDREVDEKTRVRLMEAPGRACFLWGDENVTHTTARFGGNLEKFLAAAGADCRRDGNTITFTFPAGQGGARKCLCPLVADGPERMSPTWCACSQGYVKEMFTRITGKPVDVQRLESIKTGGKQCRFRISV